MPDRERLYRIVLDGPPPADLDQRCTATWRELLDVAERLRALHRHGSERGGQVVQDDAREEFGQDREPVMAE